MPRKRNRKKTKSEHAKENRKVFKSKFSDLKKFNWTVKKARSLLISMTTLKPAGLHKHSNMLLIREHFSEKINEPVSTSAIWEYIDYYWNIDMADKLENKVVIVDDEDFDLPKNEEWLQLIEEQDSVLKINDTNKDVINQSAVSNVDLKRLKSVKVMVEKLDIPSLLVNCLKSNQIFNWNNTLQNGLDDFKTECDSSNASINIKRKCSGSVDVDANINLQKNDLALSLSSNKHSRTTKKNCISSSNVNKNKIPIFGVSTYSSPNVENNYSDIEVNNVNSNTVHNKKLSLLSQSLNTFNLFSSKNVSRFKTHDLKVSKELKLNNVMAFKSSLSLRRKSHKSRNQSITTAVISSKLDYPSRSLRSKIKSLPSTSNLKSKQSITRNIKKSKKQL